MGKTVGVDLYTDMKTLKRILVIMGIILAVLLVSYLVYTGGQVNAK